MAAEPRAIQCHRCDFGSGRRGMDRCSTCDGTGSVFRVAGQYFPNTREGYKAALAVAATLLSDHARLVEENGRLKEVATELLAADDALAAFLIGADPKALGELEWRGQHGERSARRLRAIQSMRAALSPSQKEGGGNG